MFTLWFMGRPASGKSTLASRVEDQLVQLGYPVENLDGDDIRRHLHPDLGFSREDRRTNNRRTAYIAKLFNRNDIPIIVGMITPFRDSQEQAMDIIADRGTGQRYVIPAKAADESTIRLLLSDRQQESLTVYTDCFRTY